jgi:hypothetical protein
MKRTTPSPFGRRLERKSICLRITWMRAVAAVNG